MAIVQLISTVLLLIIIDDVSTYYEQRGMSPVVVISDGKLRGRSLLSQQNNEFYAFQQIPYASPPLGQLRFKNPVPPKKWEGTVNATGNTKICYQFIGSDPRESEDCLHLNVYTPWIENSTTELLPVYVYFHGGKYIHGDSTPESYGPDFLMDYGIILVTLNHRLGPLGFISTGESPLNGNLALQDQLLALKWVRDNIRSFGGDPDKVTLGGFSSGASSVGLHMLSPQSKGLFRSAILESGSALCPKMFQKRPRYFAYRLASLLKGEDLSNNTSEDILQVLQEASAEDIKKHSNLEIPESLRNSVGNEDNQVWNPVLDGTFIVGGMHENFKRGRFSGVPTLMGINSEEELFFDLKELKSKARYFDSNDSYLVNGNLNIKEENKYMLGRELKSIYTNSTFEEDFEAFVRFMSDSKYAMPTIRQADLQSNYARVYFYQFSYHGQLGDNNHGFLEGPGRVGHTEQLNFIFRTKNNTDLKKFPKSDLDVQRRLLKMWTDFIKHGDPSPVDFKWPKVEIGNFLCVNISTTLSIEQNPRNYQKWRELYDKYADDYQETY